MTIAVRKLHETLAVEIEGVPFSRSLSQDEQAAILAATAGIGVAVFRNPGPRTDEEHVAFSRLFGPIEIGPAFKITGGTKPRISHPAIVDVGNIGADNQIMPATDRRRLFARGNQLWHTDMSFMANRATYSLLVAHEIPPVGGNTEFADMTAAYASLPDHIKVLIDDLEVEHLIWHSRRLAGFPEPTREEIASMGPAYHQLVHRHPDTGEKVLYIGAHARSIVGWRDDDARELLDSLLAHATSDAFVYRHEWRTGDLVMWDNLRTLHRGTAFDDQRHRRDMRRTTCREFPAESFVGANAH
jgi:alpha-ketoglutarate-dependent 2,4-dichlorophenoxyacetate dioxygenase